MSVPKEIQSSEATLSGGEILDLIPTLEPLPWEDKSQYQALKAAVFRELDPTTPHQQAVAQRIFENHWEQYRSQALLHDVSLAGYRKAATHMLNMAGNFMIADPKAVALVESLTSSDEAVREEALKGFADIGLTHEDICAQAYLDHIQAIETLEQRSTRQDDRRRALMREFADLKSSHQLSHVPDAEVFVDDDD